jgi:hypothetical protein
MGYQALSFLLTFGLNVLVYMFQLFNHSSKFKNILFYLYIYLVYNLAKKRPKVHYFSNNKSLAMSYQPIFF